MKLEKYLADYLLREDRKNNFVKVHHSGDMLTWDTVRCEEIIQSFISKAGGTSFDIEFIFDKNYWDVQE